MKKSVQRMFVILAVATLAANFSPSSNAASKDGSSCKKLGMRSTSGVQTLVCTKIGKKLIWKTKLKSNSVGKSSNDQEETKNAPTPVPSPTRIIRYNGPQNPQAFDAIQPVYKVLNQVSVELASRADKGKKAEVALFSDEPNNPLVASTKDVVAKTTAMMRAIDVNFLDNEVYLFRKISWLKTTELSKKCSNLIDNQERYGWANAGCDRYWVGDFEFYEDPKNYFGKSRHTPRTLLGFTGAHETVHLIQIGNRNGQSSKFPSWYREGSASVGAGLVMVALSDYANGDYNAVDDWELNSWSKARCGAVFNEWKVKHDEAGHAATNNCEYSVGRRMIEFLVAHDKTFDNIYNVYSSVGENLTFNDAFEKYHGIKIEEFFAQVESWLEKIGWGTAVTY